MAKRQRKHNDKHFSQALQKLKRLNGRHRCQAIKMANNNFIRQLCSHVKQLKHKKIHPKYRKALSSRKATLRKLSNSKTSLKTKRKILSQKGGLLPLLIPLLSTLGPIAGAAISKGITG